VALDRFRDLFGPHVHFPGEEVAAYHTLAGFLLYQLGYIPRAAECVEWDEFKFEVLDMDGNRIDRILVVHTPRPPAPSADEDGVVREDS